MRDPERALANLQDRMLEKGGTGARNASCMPLVTVPDGLQGCQDAGPFGNFPTDVGSALLDPDQRLDQVGIVEGPENRGRISMLPSATYFACEAGVYSSAERSLGFCVPHPNEGRTKAILAPPH